MSDTRTVMGLESKNDAIRRILRERQEPVPDTPSPPPVDYSEMSKSELKEAARARGLAVSGSKADLVERLEA